MPFEHKFDVWDRNPGGKKRCLIVRFGAIGDQIIASSLLPLLKAEGFHVTYQCTPEAQQILRHNPHIDAWWIQAKDFVPNQQLGPYWESLAERFDRVVNLCESIEGTLLALPGRREAAWSLDIRRKMVGGINYLAYAHDLAGVPHVFRPQFHPTRAETIAADAVRATMDGPVIVWAVDGSSHHKAYPHTHIVTAWLLERTTCHVVYTGGPGQSEELQAALMTQLIRNGSDIRRVHPMAGVWGIREALAFAQRADCVVGPETGLLNAVSFEAMPKVIYLSHSSHDNLTQHWRNTHVVLPDTAAAPCYPCHLMHYGWEHCVQDAETKAAACAASITPQTLFRTISKAVLGQID